MLPAGEQGGWTETGRKKASTRTWPVQELSFPLLEGEKILGTAYIRREAILARLPVTFSLGSNPGARAEPQTPTAGVPWPDPAAQASCGPLTSETGKRSF